MRSRSPTPTRTRSARRSWPTRYRWRPCCCWSAGQDRVERGGEVRSPVPDHELHPRGLFAEVHDQVACLLRDPPPVLPRTDLAARRWITAGDRRLASGCWLPDPDREERAHPTAPRCRRAHARRGGRRDFRRGSATRLRRRRSCPGHTQDLDDQDGLVAVSGQHGLNGLVERLRVATLPPGLVRLPGRHQQPPWGLARFHAPGAVPVIGFEV